MKGIWDMKKDTAVIIKLKAGSEAIKDFEASFTEDCESRTNYRYYIADPREMPLVRSGLEKNHLYYLLAAVYDDDKIIGAYLGCGQFVVKDSICCLRLFVRAKSEYNENVREIFELADAAKSPEISIVKSKAVGDRIGALINSSADGKVKEISIA